MFFSKNIEDFMTSSVNLQLNGRIGIISVLLQHSIVVSVLPKFCYLYSAIQFNIFAVFENKGTKGWLEYLSLCVLLGLK